MEAFTVRSVFLLEQNILNPSVYCNFLYCVSLNEQHCEIQTQRAAASVPLTNATLDTMSFNFCMREKCSTEIRPSRPATRRLLGGCSTVTVTVTWEPMGRHDASREPRPGQSFCCRLHEAWTSCHASGSKDGSGIFKLHWIWIDAPRQWQTTSMLTGIW